MANGYDHDHETDQVRAALCAQHNVWLSVGGDTAASLRAIATWLENADLGFTYSEARQAWWDRWHADHPNYMRDYDSAHRIHRREAQRMRRAVRDGYV